MFFSTAVSASVLKDFWINSSNEFTHSAGPTGFSLQPAMQDRVWDKLIIIAERDSGKVKEAHLTGRWLR
jgi:hypothetical protein